MHHMFQINHLALITAAAIQWAIGVLWYGVFFKKSWTAKVGGNSGNAIFTLVCAFVASIMLCFGLVHVILWAGAPKFMGGAALAIICWLAFMAPPLLVLHIQEKRPVNLFAINLAYWMVAMAVSGGVLAVWR